MIVATTDGRHKINIGNCPLSPTGRGTSLKRMSVSVQIGQGARWKVKYSVSPGVRRVPILPGAFHLTVTYSNNKGGWMQSKYDKASEALGMDVGDYLRDLKAMTGLSDTKLGHDLEKDSGVWVPQPTIWTWRNNK